MVGKRANAPPRREPHGAGSAQEPRTPAEHEGGVAVERLVKDDGRALILYTVAEAGTP